MVVAYNKVGSMSYNTFKRKAMKLGVWEPNRGAKDTLKPVKSLQDVFDGKIKMRSYRLKQRLIEENYKLPKCEHCGVGEEWNGLPLVLELDHIDGNSDNNKLDNLRILCPNCHSQTPTFRGRKLKNRPRDGIGESCQI